MSISYVATQNTTFSGSGTSFSFTTPSAAQSGDLLVALFAYNTPSTTDVSNTLPSGWTEAPPASGGQFDSGTSNGSSHSVVATKSAVGGTETFAWTTASTVSNAVATVVAYRGANTTTPWDQTTYVDEASSTTSHTTGSITPTITGSWVFATWALRNNDDWIAPTGSPALTVRAADISANGGSDSSSPGTHVEVADSNGSTVSSGTSYSFTAATHNTTSVSTKFIGNIRPANILGTGALTSAVSISAGAGVTEVASATLTSASSITAAAIRTAAPPVLIGMSYALKDTGTSNVVSLPAGANVGDLAYLVAYDTGTPTTPSGWTVESSGYVSNTAFYSKVLDGTDISNGYVAAGSTSSGNGEATMWVFQRGTVATKFLSANAWATSVTSAATPNTQALGNSVALLKLVLTGSGNTTTRSLPMSAGTHDGSDAYLTLDFGYLTSTTPPTTIAETWTVTGTNNTFGYAQVIAVTSALGALGTATLTSASSLAASGTTVSVTQAPMVTTSSITVGGSVTAVASVTLTSAAVLAVGEQVGVATLVSTSSLTVAAVVNVLSSSVTLTSSSGMTTVGSETAVGRATLTTIASIGLVPAQTWFASVALGTGSLLTTYGTSPPRVESSSTYGPLAVNTAPVPAPSGLAQGDLLVALHFLDPDGSLAAMGAPDGTWTLKDSNSNAAGKAKVWYKIATNSEPATYNFTGTNVADGHVIMLRITNFNSTAPFNVAPTWGGTTTTSTSHVAPTVTTSVANALLINAFQFIPENTAFTWTTPSGETADVSTSATAHWLSALVAHKAVSAAGATGTVTATASITDTSPYGDMTVAFAVAPLAPVVPTYVGLASSSSISGTGVPIKQGAASLSSTSSVTVSASYIPVAQATLTTGSTLSASGVTSTYGQSSLTTTSGLGAVAARTAVGVVTLACAPSIIVIAKATQTAASTLTSAAVMHVQGYPPTRLSSAAAMSVTGLVMEIADPEPLSSLSRIIVVADNHEFAAAPLTSVSSMTTVALRTTYATTNFSTSAVLLGRFIFTGQAKLTSQSKAITTGTTVKLGAAALTNQVRLKAPGVVIKSGAAALPTTASITVVGVLKRPGVVHLSTTPTLTVAGAVLPQARAYLRSASSLAAVAGNKAFGGTVPLLSHANLTVIPVVKTSSGAALASVQTLTAAAYRLGPNSVVRGWGIRL